mgnify:CR=1 FL=1
MTIALHLGVVWGLAIPPLNYLVMYAGFGFSWSADGTALLARTAATERAEPGWAEADSPTVTVGAGVAVVMPGC